MQRVGGRERVVGRDKIEERVVGRECGRERETVAGHLHVVAKEQLGLHRFEYMHSFGFGSSPSPTPSERC